MLFLVLIAAAIAFPFPLNAQEFLSLTPLNEFSVTATTGEKPQSKVWTYYNYWWAVMPNSTGTKLFRLDGTSWTSVLSLSPATDTHADVKVAGNTVHILLFRGTSSELVSVEYVPASHGYQLWPVRPSNVPITLDSGVETATIDLDSNGRMWLASDGNTNVNIRWSDSPYSSWNGPITLVNNISTDDISRIIAFDGKVGVFWSNQNTQRFGFRDHVDEQDPSIWSADEVPASQSAYNVGAGMADDHMNIAAATDGTLYCAVKTSYDTPGYPKIALLVRRPAGTWDNLYPIDESGTRGISLLDESNSTVTIVYTASEGLNDIVYRQSYLSPISFGPRRTLINGPYNDATSTKQNYDGQIVVLAGDGSSVAGVIAESALPPLDSLAAHWAMNEGSGTILIDSSTNNNNATLLGNPVWVDGVRGQALSLNGSTQYCTAADNASLDISNAITLAAWIKPEIQNTQYLIKKALIGSVDGYELSLSSDGRVFARFNQAASGDAYRLNSRISYPRDGNTWVHVAAAYDGASLKLYINGVLDTSRTFSTVIGTNNVNLGIGAQPDGNGKYQGKIDDARIYTYALSPSEVLALSQHLIIASAGSNGSISPSGNVIVNHGVNQIFTIVPNAGFQVADVLVDGFSVGPLTSYTFSNVSGDHSISASFTLDSFIITSSAGPNGSISPSGNINVNYGDDQEFTMTPAVGYHVNEILVDGISIGPATSYVFTNVIANHTIAVNFAPDTFVITASAGANGTISPSGEVNVNYGDDQTFIIAPDTGYQVADVLIDGISAGPLSSYTFTNVSTDHSISAAFAIATFTITAAAGEHGQISPDGAIAVDYGDSQAFIIAPDTGCYIQDVIVDNISMGPLAEYTFSNVHSNHTINALFVIDTFTIIAFSDPNGTIQPSGNINIEYGSDATFTFAPDTGYHLLDVVVDGNSVGPIAEYTFSDVNSDHVIDGSFAVDIFTITASAGPNGSINPSGDISIYYGNSITFQITPDQRYIILDVIVDGVSIGAATQFRFENVRADHTINAVFGGCSYVVGDVNGSSMFNGLDVTYAVSYFKGGPPPVLLCECPPHGAWYVAGDVNGSCTFNGLDVSAAITYFKGGPPPIPCPDCPPSAMLAPPDGDLTPQTDLILK